jgi:TonB family protein
VRAARFLKFVGGLLMLVAIGLPVAAPSVRASIARFLKPLTAISLDSFVPSRGTVTQQPQPIPWLDQAKTIIPTNLTHIYDALNQGNPQGARPYLSQQLAGNYQALDQICKPFTYRAHYIEAIIERERGWFEVRVRVLFQPMDEHAYVLRFFMAEGGAFYLNDVLDPSDDWFGPEKEAATELARNFIYAAKANKAEELVPLLVPSIPAEPFATDRCWQQFFFTTKEPRINSVQLKSYKGLKMEVALYLSPAVGFGYSALGQSRFLVDRVGDGYKIVSADPRGDYNMLFLPEAECPDKSVLHKVEDPNLEEETLKRFGIRPAVSAGVKAGTPEVTNGTHEVNQTSASSGDGGAVSSSGSVISQRVRVPENVMRPLLINGEQPTYPPLAQQAGIAGTVVLQAEISKTGTVEEARLVSGHPMLAGAAIDAVKRWQYKPYIENGQPVEVETQITLPFAGKFISVNK